jgi:hypothetical protein
MVITERHRPSGCEGSGPRRARRSAARRLALVAAASVLLAACTSGTQAAPITVTSNTTVAASATAGPAPAEPTTGAAASTSSAGPRTPTTATMTTATAATTEAAAGAQPDGFVPTKLKPGQKPPQFIILSFDGVGWHEKWQYWKSIQDRVPLHFTGFLSGTYMLSTTTNKKYDGPGDGPGHGPGQASISFDEPADLPVQIADLNDALEWGDEIGTHFNGHFCDDNQPGANEWDTADWNNELDQFFALVKNVDVNNGITEKLDLPAGEIKGERTPCLEGTQDGLYPALQAHGMTYDTSFTRNGLYWPTQTTKFMTGGYKIWQIGMSQFPIEGPVLDHPSHHKQITMDFNFYYSQRHASSDGVTTDQSAKDSAQVLATYNAMFDAVHTGNRAPMILGNHFEAWNNNAYTNALGAFVLARCGQPDVRCVPFRDLIAWMNAQDPAVLAQLQDQQPEFGNPSN